MNALCYWHTAAINKAMRTWSRLRVLLALLFDSFSLSLSSPNSHIRWDRSQSLAPNLKQFIIQILNAIHSKVQHILLAVLFLFRMLCIYSMCVDVWMCVCVCLWVNVYRAFVSDFSIFTYRSRTITIIGIKIWLRWKQVHINTKKVHSTH